MKIVIDTLILVHEKYFFIFANSWDQIEGFINVFSFLTIFKYERYNYFCSCLIN